MPYSVTQQDILEIRADAAVLCVEIAMNANASPVSQRLAGAGGEALRAALRRQKFLPIGSAAAVEPCGLPFDHIIITAAPRWLTGKSNELLALHRCYESVYEQAEALGCRTLAMPFLSACYYRFPQEDAVNIALTEAAKRTAETLFVAETPELYDLSRRAYRKPEIISYVGYYRDHAIFSLDNGLFARVDLRPEITEVAVIPYFEACYRVGNNPLQEPLSESEIARLRQIYEDNDW